jgi:hypothetical protein
MQEIKNSKPARHVLLHVLFPDQFERVASHADKEKLEEVEGGGWGWFWDWELLSTLSCS